MDSRVLIGKLSDFAQQVIYRKKVGQLDLILIRSGDKVFALENRCSHEDFPLEDGDIETCDGSLCVVCPAHGAKFSLEDGKPLALPAVDKIRCYEIEIAGDEVFLKQPN
jgi:3-phenylpropionate/trans-cinnamate dioxygenase ferredoxin subunit